MRCLPETQSLLLICINRGCSRPQTVPMCCDRSWSAAQVRTYDVVPVSRSLGLVEFVPATQPLKQAIMAFLEPEVRRLWVSGAVF